MNETEFYHLLQHQRRFHWLAWLILVAGLIVTAVAAFYVKMGVEENARLEFNILCNELKVKIEDRFSAHARLLKSCAAFFDASDNVTREAWHIFNIRQKIEQQLQGIQGIGFSLVIPPERLLQHEQEIRSQGFPNYHVKPKGEREIYTSIIYLEPFSERNLRAFGYDMFSEPVRRDAMERSRDTDSAALSGKVVLVLETDKDVQAGTVMYVPVYRKGMPIDTIEQRRAAIYGWVCSSYRMNDLMQGILGEWDKHQGLHFRVFDGEELSPDTLLYDYDRVSDGQKDRDTASGYESSLTLNIKIFSAGRLWTLSVRQEGQASSTYSVRLWLVVSGGITICILFSILAFSLLTTASNAKQMAAKLIIELKRNEQSYRNQFINNSVVMLLIDTADGSIVDANIAAISFYGFDRETLTSMRITDINTLPASEVKRAISSVPESYSGLFQFQHRLADGSIRDVEVSSTRIQLGRRIFLHSIIHDITKRKIAENALEHEKERLIGIIEGTRAGTWEWNVQTGETIFNDIWAEMIGYTLEEISPTSIETWMKFAHPDDLKISYELLEKHFDGEVEYYEFESRMQHKNGNWIWVLDRGKVSTWTDDGKPLWMMGTHQDITQLKDAIARAEKMAEKAEKADIAKSRFLANMSHEIRTPMNAVLGFAQILERDSSLNPEQSQCVNYILRSGSHLLDIINDILDISKIEANKETLKPVGFSLHDFIDDLDIIFRARTDAKGLKLTVERDHSVPCYVTADHGKLRQIFINLIGNAIKFTERGEVTLRVKAHSINNEPLTGMENGMKTVCIVAEIEDSGVGISDEEIEYLFVPFRQGEAGLKEGGTGLGLVISSRLAEMMGGSIKVTSQRGRGSCFRVEVFVDLAHNASTVKTISAFNVVTLEQSPHRFRILVVDDKPDNRSLLRLLLEPVGFEIKEAVNGIEAIKLFEEWSPHAILMDIRMPLMDGCDAVQHIRSTEKGKTVFIIAITASAFEDEREMVLQAGADVYLPKPFQSAELFSVLLKIDGVNYIFADNMDNNDHSQPKTLSPDSIYKALSKLPDSTIHIMYQMLNEWDMSGFAEMLKEVGQVDPNVANELQLLVDEYDYDQLNEYLTEMLPQFS